MSSDARDIIAKVVDDHESVEMRVVDGHWRAICFCDADLGPIAGPFVSSSNDEALRLHEAHRAQAVLDALTAAGWVLLPPGTESRTALVVPDSPKTLRETLCVAQTHVGLSGLPRAGEHVARLQRLINECDRHRPLGPDGKHGDRHTPTCGCTDGNPTPTTTDGAQT